MSSTLASPAQAVGDTRYKVLGAISLSHFLNDLLQSLIIAIYPLLKGNYDLNFTQIGLLTGLAFALVPVAAPDYLARAGTPQHPLDLLQHQRIDFLTPYDRKAWPAYFYRDGEEIEIPPQGRIALDNSQACLALARQGMGIYADYALQLKDDLASGRLQRILPDWDMLSWPLFWANASITA